jgi:hypothetical protein
MTQIVYSMIWKVTKLLRSFQKYIRKINSKKVISEKLQNGRQKMLKTTLQILSQFQIFRT